MKQIETTKLPSQECETLHRALNKAFFGTVLVMDESSFSGVIIDARVLERDKSYLGNRLKVTA